MGVEISPLPPVWTDALSLHSFMLQDVLGSLAAVPAFALVLYAPGYLLGYAMNLFGFRRMALAEQSLWAIACSFSAVPILAYLVGRSAGLSGLRWLLFAAAIGTLLLLFRNRESAVWPRRDRAITALLACGWTAFALLMLVDAQVGHKLYFSVVTADQSYRIAFTDAVVRTGIPPANPLYVAGSPAPMPYYYFWYVLCAAVMKFAHVSARQAFIASSIWAGFGLMVTVQLYTSYFFRWGRRQRWIALGLLGVTGADLLPALGQAVWQPSLNGDIEWWSVDPIDAWPDSLLWVPHHVAGVVCCLLAFLLLWRTLEASTPEVDTRRNKHWAVFLAAAAFAGAFGLSVYVAIGFALLMAAWLLWLLVRRDPQRAVWWRRITVAGLLSAAALAPFLHELTSGIAHAASGKASGQITPATHLFSLSVRSMIDSGLLTRLPLFASWNRTHPLLLDQTIRLILLVPGLAMELGVYGAVLVLLLFARRHRGPERREQAREISLFFVLGGLIMALFLSSAVITNNDFGYRAVMLPQFFLTLLTADVLGSWWNRSEPAPVRPTPGRLRLVYGLLALGVAGSIYWAVLLRAWLPLETRRVQNGFNQLPGDAFQIREAFAMLNRIAAKDAVVAFRPIDPTPDRKEEVMTPNEFYQRLLVMDTGKQLLNAEGKCATHFGGDPSACAAIQQATAELYTLPAPNTAWAQGYCHRFGVQYLVLSAWDPDWNTDTGWPRTLPVVAQEPRFRILQCN